MNKRVVNVGDRIGRLTVVQEVPKDASSSVASHRKSRRFLFRCDCGGQTTTTWGSAHSCGCIQREVARRTGTAKRKPPGEASFNGLYVGYLNRATRDEIEFTLTRDQFKLMACGNCFYCGSPPTSIRKAGRYSYGAVAYNGIDRAVPDLGYTPENTVACCPQCNFAKHAVPQAEFLNGSREFTDI